MSGVTLCDAILVLVPAATFGRQGTVQVADQADGKGPQVVGWNTAALGQQPTAKALDAVTPAQVAAYRRLQARAQAQALLDDPGGTGTALRAIYLAAGLTAQQVTDQLPAASGG